MSRIFKALEDVDGLLESVQNMRGIYSIESPDKSITYLDFDAFFTRLKYMYFDRKMMFYEGESETDTFERMWLMYLNTTESNYIKAFDAMLEKYAPLENYNRIEETTQTDNSISEFEKNGSEIQSVKGDLLKRSGTDTSTVSGDLSTKSGSQSVATVGDMSVKNGSETHTTNYGKKTSTYTNGYNALSESNIPIKDIQEDSGVDTSEIQYNGTKDSTDMTQTTTFDNYKDSANYSTQNVRGGVDSADYSTTTTFVGRNDTETKENSSVRNSNIHGNIGVTTSQEMLESELNLRKKNLMLDYIDSFFKTYTYYC